MDVADVVATHVTSELPDRLDEGHDLDVAHRATDLDDDHVEIVRGKATNSLLDLVGHVRDHLHRLAEVVPSALLGDH